MKKLMVAVVLTLFTLFNFQVEARTHHTKRHHHHHVKKRVHNRKKHKVRKHHPHRISSSSLHSIVLDVSAKHNVPAEIVLAVMYYETGYRGADHKSYNGRRVSRCGAVGPMQVMPRYAGKMMGRKISRGELLYNYVTNIEVGVRMLAYHHKLYGSWSRALGAYSTGRPLANKYSRKILHKANQIEEEMLIAGTNC